MSLPTIALRGGLQIDNPLAVALGFIEAYLIDEGNDSARRDAFGERDLRLANRDGARISATQIALILERRSRVDVALRTIPLDASLADSAVSIPWTSLRRLFDAFADIPGVGFSKMTKALHRKRPALIPILDSVVQRYLTTNDPAVLSAGSFGERATSLVQGYKRDLDRNRSALREMQRELARGGHRLTEVRLLDILIWSACAPTSPTRAHART
jgi:hypothetical protein